MLRGVGAAVALPLLDAMLPAFVPLAKAAAKPRMRFGAVYFPNGAIMQQLTPKTVGAGFEFTPILKPLEPFSDSLIVVTNLTRSHPGSQFGDHAVSAAGFLTGVWPKRTEAEDVLANTTIDQVVAQQIGQDTPLPSLEVATEDFTGYVGGCSPGFSCAYLNTISWSTPSTPLPMEINPRAVFERLFGAAGTTAQRQARSAKGTQHSGFGGRGSQRLCSAAWAHATARGCTDYLDNLREIERRIQRQEARSATQVDTPDAPIGVPDSFDEHVALHVRLARRGLSGRHHARVHLHDVARAQPADLSADRRHRAASLRFASSEQAGEDGAGGEDQHLLCRNVREVPGEVAGHSGWRRHRCSIIR